jgi:hypothetical protein
MSTGLPPFKNDEEYRSKGRAFTQAACAQATLLSETYKNYYETPQLDKKPLMSDFIPAVIKELRSSGWSFGACPMMLATPTTPYMQPLPFTWVVDVACDSGEATHAIMLAPWALFEPRDIETLTNLSLTE